MFYRVPTTHTHVHTLYTLRPVRVRGACNIISRAANPRGSYDHNSHHPSHCAATDATVFMPAPLFHTYIDRRLAR